ncbi:alpha/beta hydrolase-fold protein [Helicobacter sp. 11S02596-1]|uniref:alpha/beta hydrolase n=1 Tax=Helicobacter sp. 11S02596-1 TaxID=1476194 RepID=UPI000BA553D5|nr:alpha/beta hydrolase-fold protein [Helicobacter sp. 11S02596-1]PAF42501.1 hypothetical protein BJI48_06800 [Helicobacter sp. 11S02596-1]
MKIIALAVFLGLGVGLKLSALPNQNIPKIQKKVYQYFTIKDFILKSAQGKDYKIFLAIPLKNHGKYRVLYMLDGNKQFPMILNAYEPITNPPLIVAIGYPGELGYDIVRRTFDYTPKVDGTKIAHSEKFAKGGGAEFFYDFITHTLKPFIAKHYAIDSENQTLFGHSFGGLFALYVMFYHPEAFSDYIAASPSLWWGDGSFIPQDDDRKIKAKTPSQTPLEKHPPKSITITIGEYENKPSSSPFTAESLAKKLSKGGWGVQERQITQSVRETQETQKTNVCFVKFPGQTHGSSIIYALRIALKSFGSTKCENRF